MVRHRCMVRNPCVDSESSALPLTANAIRNARSTVSHRGPFAFSGHRLTTVANPLRVSSVGETRDQMFARLDELNRREGRPTRITAPWVLRLLASAVTGPAKSTLEASARPRAGRAAATHPVAPPVARRPVKAS